MLWIELYCGNWYCILMIMEMIILRNLVGSKLFRIRWFCVIQAVRCLRLRWTRYGKTGLIIIFGRLTTTCSFSFWDLHFSNELSSSMMIHHGGVVGTLGKSVTSDSRNLSSCIPFLYRPLCPAFKPQTLHFLPNAFFFGQGGGVTTHPSNVCWSAPVLFGGSPSLDLTRQLKFEEENIWGDANKNGSFARLRGRSKVSLC